MAQKIDTDRLEETVVKINRCTNVTKGGKSMSFSALVVVGDKNGTIGYGFGKAREVPNAVGKAVKDANKNVVSVPIVNGTITHEVWGRYKTARVFMKPAAPGTGVKAGTSARTVLESAGITDILTKCYGTRNPLNVVKATAEGLKSLRTRQEIELLRGVKIE
ncbi:MAG: 30S ribosomal protein S5 [Planctomycetes bacterium GWA2_40_7]|nr:MAG: 30S ribosomal protein S5 [Planctomycetes bacterium GWA2_40_7]OHB47866.1 MAG: 30S ribosomal protein S5 [Planctomycetes bacterium GWF2_40_8]OHB90747.1 MAG: 30S ribosomal protein S5 [Planctomycetes bacterium RIFCSPHIGHO2_02_FULL_40_12]OHC02062.1 MAG: 30S ribosomal protein S5 [Planctomycetes bacterium RIFCSPLOWO2_12_FULL_40_19]